MLIDTAIDIARRASERFDITWLDANPLTAQRDEHGRLHRDPLCGHARGGPTTVGGLWVHRGPDRRWCGCVTSVAGAVEDWLCCAHDAMELHQALATKHTCFDALDVILAAADLHGSLHSFGVFDPPLAAHISAAADEAHHRLGAATPANRESAVRSSRLVAEQWCGAGDGHAIVLVELGHRAPTFAAPYPLVSDRRHLIAAVPDVVAHGIAASLSSGATRLIGDHGTERHTGAGRAHVEHVDQQATRVQLETALALWGDIAQPEQVWAATVALTA